MIANFLSQLGPFWTWLLLGALLLGMELVLPGVHFVWFGVAAALMAFIVQLTGMVWGWQLITFATVAAGLVMFMRGYASPLRFKSDQPDLNARAHQYIGRTVVIEEAIAAGRGKVRVDDTLWSARGPDLPSGTRVRVAAVEGSVLVVEPL